MVKAIDLYFLDETGVTMQPYLPYGWQKKGAPLSIFARCQHKRLNLLGLMSLDNRLTVYPSEQSLTGAVVASALQDFLAVDHDKPVVIVLDNGPIHRCQTIYNKIAAWEANDAFLFFLPTYSPHLNPIEIYWRFLKYRWLKKLHYSSWSKLKAAIEAIIAEFGSGYRINFKELIQRNMCFNSA